MNSDLGVVRTVRTTSGPRWVAQQPAVSDPITLDADAVLAVYPDGNIPSGAALKLAATGRHVPYAGTGAAKGFLLVDKQVRAGRHVDAALYARGRVYEDLLPANSGFDAGARAAMSPAIYFDKVGA